MLSTVCNNGTFPCYDVSSFRIAPQRANSTPIPQHVPHIPVQAHEAGRHLLHPPDGPRHSHKGRGASAHTPHPAGARGMDRVRGASLHQSSPSPCAVSCACPSLPQLHHEEPASTEAARFDCSRCHHCVQSPLSPVSALRRKLTPLCTAKRLRSDSSGLHAPCPLTGDASP